MSRDPTRPTDRDVTGCKTPAFSRKRLKKKTDNDVEEVRSKHLLLLLALALAGLLLLLLLAGVLALVAGLVHLVEQAQASVLELIGLLLNLGSGSGALAGLARGDELAHGCDLLLDLLGLSLVETVLKLLEGLLGVVDDAVGAVGGLDGVLALLVLLGVLLRVTDHGLDLGVGEAGTGSDGDRLILVGGLVLCVDVDNGVSVNVERDLNLGHTAVGGRDTDKLEVSEQLIVTDKLTLTLIHLDLDSALEISSRGEYLRLLGGDGRVTVDQTGENTTERLDTKGQGGNVEQEKVGDLASKNSTLDGSTNSDSLVRVDRLCRVAAEDALDRLGNLGHTGHTTDKDDLRDLLGLEIGILEGLANRVDSPADERVHHLLKLGAGELGVDVLGAGSIGSDERQVDVGLRRGRKLNLGLLGSLADTLDGHAVAVQVDALLLLELLDKVAHEGDVEVLTTEVSVSVGRLDLEDTVLDLEDRDIECATSQIVNSDDVVGGLIKTVCEGGSGGLIDDTEDVESGNHTGVLGGLTLGVVEVGGDGDDGVLDVLAHVGLGSLLHLSEDEATHLRRRVLLSLGLEPSIAVGVLDNLVGHLLDIALDLAIGELAADEALGSEKSVLWVDNGLALGSNTNEALAFLGEANDGGSGAATWSRISTRARLLVNAAKTHLPSSQ
jgi:hypothetical protein